MGGGKGVVFKVSRESSGGHGIRLIHSSDSEGFRKEVVETMRTMGCDYVVQEMICQHEQMARFNPTSVNTFRLETLYLNGRASLCCALLRIGQHGSVVDNMCSGGMGIGVDEDGSLHDYGYDYGCHQISEMNNVKFSGKKLGFVPGMIEMVLKAHEEDFPLSKFIGWDVCVESNGSFTVIEINSSQPGIFVEQLNCGPIFGDRTDEVIEYVKGKDFKYNRGVLNY